MSNQPTAEEKELIEKYYTLQGAVANTAARLEGALTAGSRRARWSNFAGKKDETKSFFQHLVESINNDVSALFEGADELNRLSLKINESLQSRITAAMTREMSQEESLPQ